MKYLQLFESTRHPWSGEPRQFYILWSDDGQMLDNGSGPPKELLECPDVVRLRLGLHVKIKDFERTLIANPPGRNQEDCIPG